MGQKISLPVLGRRTLEIVTQYNITESHLETLWALFLKKDTNFNSAWTLHECYELIQEPRATMVSPFIDALFGMASSENNGQISFEDFLVAFLSYCALSREEVMQFMFLVLDSERNSYVTKAQLTEFFTRTAPGEGEKVFYFPANNVNSLELFHKGKWDKLIFDEVAQLVECFPLVGFAVFHLQFLLRNALLGEAFWARWDQERLRAFYMEAESMTVREEKKVQGEVISISKPGRFTFKEILEYGRRKSFTHKGRKVSRQEKPAVKGSITDERDEAISRTPLLNIVRNPTNPYHVPYMPPTYRDPEAELTEFNKEIELREESDKSCASDSD